MQEKDYDKCHEPLAFPVSFSSRSLHADLRMKIDKKKINLKKIKGACSAEYFYYTVALPFINDKPFLCFEDHKLKRCPWRFTWLLVLPSLYQQVSNNYSMSAHWM